MRVALVHSFYSSAQPSGENSVVTDQLAALRSAGHDVELVARRTDELQNGRGYALRSAATVATGVGPDPGRQLRAFEPDVVHVHNTFPNWGVRGLLAWADRAVVTLHNYRPVCTAATLFRDGQPCTQCLTTPVLPAIRHACYRGSTPATVPVALGTRPGGPARRLLREAAAVVVLNEEARRVYQQQLRRAVDVVPNFVDDARADVGRPRHGWVYVGRFTPEKGVVRLVEDWPSGEPLDVIGSGPDEPLVQEAARRRPEVTVHAPLPRGQVLARLGGYEGLVLPSVWAEGLPTVVLEAMAAGTPSVVSTAVATSAHLAQARAAVTYDPAAGPADLARALGDVRRNGSTLVATTRAAHASTYSRPAWLAAIGGVYARIA